MTRQVNLCLRTRIITGSYLLVAGLLVLSTTAAAQTWKRDRIRNLASERSTTFKVTFAYSPRYPIAGQAIQFYDTSSGTPTAYAWDFGDGSTSNEKNPTHVYISPGFRRVILTASLNGTAKKTSRTITVMPDAKAATFIFSPMTPGPGQVVQFTDTTAGTPSSWRWDFGDGTTSTIKNPSHVFSRAGRYIVSLKASNRSGTKQGSQTLSVVSLSILTTSFSFAPATPATGQSIQFTDSSTGGPISWLWDFGDGTTSRIQNPTHSYETAGPKTVNLTTTNSTSTQAAARTITVVPNLTAAFMFNPTLPATGQSIQFTDTSIGNPTSWLWDFGDGVTSASQNPIHAFATGGTKTVTLSVTNATSSARTSRSVTIVADIDASFSFNPSEPVTGQSVQFTDTSLGTPSQWQWDFGDGITSSAQNPIHSYKMAGTFSVSLSVMNASGQDSVVRAITVTEANTLRASFSYSPGSPIAGQAVQFTDASSGFPTAWHWDFNDGTTGTTKNPIHTFATAGAFSVSLTVSNASGSNTVTQTLVIGTAPSLVAGFTFSPKAPAMGQSIQFSDISTGKPESWQWDFGNGSSSTAQNPVYTYTSAGTFTIALTIRAGNSVDSTTESIYVTPSDVITAASPSYADVAAAISAAVAGGTVLVPAGTATWSTNLVITKAITLIGAGQGQTVITSARSGSGNTGDPNNWLISYVPSSPANDAPFRLSGFSLNCANLCGAVGLFNTNVMYPQTKIRVDHITITNARHSCIVFGPIYGVMDNCNLSQAPGVYFNFLFYSLDTIWANHTFTLGTGDNFYVEDCVLNCGLTDGGCTNAGFGQRYAIRRCTINAQGHLFSCWDAHGNMGAGNGWSTQGIELYENTINAGNYMVIVFDHRGGEAAVWGNNLFNNVSAGYQIREEYYDSNNPPAVAPNGQPQHPSGSYYWLNRKNNTILMNPGVAGTLDYPGLPSVPTENREFWTERASFDGSSGIGVGLFSSRPATAAAGVGYWATDARKLFVWSGSGWQDKYTPYTYPHPLRTILAQ